MAQFGEKSNMTPEVSSTLKRDANSPPDVSISTGATNTLIKPAKLVKLTSDAGSFITNLGASVNPGEDDPNLNFFQSPPTSPAKLSIKEQIHNALSGPEFLAKIALIVSATVEAALPPIEPQLEVFEEKIGNLTTGMEILQSDLNDIKNQTSAPHAIASAVKNLLSDVDMLKKQMKAKDDLIMTLNKRVEHLEAYSRRNAIRITNIPTAETRGNDPDWMVNFASKHMGVNLNIHEIGRMHRTGPLTPGKPRDILVKFIGYYSRAKIFSKKTFLTSHDNPERRPGVYINEHLTQQRANLFFLARKGVKARKITASWTYDGSVITKLDPGKETPIRRWDHNSELIQYLTNLPTLPPPVIEEDDTTPTG